jgi:hypothetical protein
VKTPTNCELPIIEPSAAFPLTVNETVEELPVRFVKFHGVPGGEQD